MQKKLNLCPCFQKFEKNSKPNENFGKNYHQRTQIKNFEI